MSKLVFSLTLAIFLALMFAIGWWGASVTLPAIDQWYAVLNKPPFTPANALFAPVWTLLYILIAIAGTRLWHARSSARARLRQLFFIQLIFMGLWSPIFFGLNDLRFALADILLLWGFLLALIRLAWREEKISAGLLAPYFLWVTFATYLNIGLWWLNR